MVALVMTIIVPAYPKNQRSPLSNSIIRKELTDHLKDDALQRRSAAHQQASRKGWKTKGTVRNRSFELMDIVEDIPIYFQTCNTNSAISQAVDLIRDTTPYNLDGYGITVGLWDAGAVRRTHQEFGSRINLIDTIGYHSHSTHVAGTLAAAGIVSSAMGMAPELTIDSYNWSMDLAEMTNAAASYPNEPGKIYLSSHSYGTVTGWEYANYSGNSGRHWFGQYGYREDENFGKYGYIASTQDLICYQSRYYLPFWAAGNNRDDYAPLEGRTFYYTVNGSWRSKAYNGSTDPYKDGYDGGYDTLLPTATAKNIVSVGAVHDAVANGQRNITRAYMTRFSGWGPTDDGRIKPDIVCNGYNLYSSTASSDVSYANYSGTSMATPSAAGAAALLIQLYNECFPQEAMLSSTLKALLIHTADDIGNPGPDYINGWGLVNAHGAAELIDAQCDDPFAQTLIEAKLDRTNPSDNYMFNADGSTAIKITLCWTDLPAGSLTGLDNDSLRLINDLDLRVIDPDGFTVYYPFVLDPDNPSANAVTGDNFVDNVEQVYIDMPVYPGTYVVEVSHKYSLANNQQDYSLILSNQITDDPTPPLAGFQWDPIQSPQAKDDPIEVVITARDALGQVHTDFNGTVDISAWTGDQPNNTQVGKSAFKKEFPVSVSASKRRMQSIYLASEIGGAGTINALAIDIAEMPGSTRKNWTIRLKHTNLSKFYVLYWESDDWTVVYKNDQPPVALGWEYYNFTTPFEYDGTSNLIVDISFDNAESALPGGTARTTNFPYRSLACAYNANNYGGPTTWTGRSPLGYITRQSYVPNIKFSIGNALTNLPITPQQTGNFVNGIWSGQVTVHDQATDVSLRCDDGFGNTGESDIFDVTSSSDPLDPDPIPPFDPVPADGADEVDIAGDLSWQPVPENSCTVTYDVYLDLSNPPTTLICTDTTATSCTPTLAHSRRYYWQVIATDCTEQIPGGVWSFTTQSPPVTVELDYFQWDNISSPKTAGAAFIVAITAKDTLGETKSDFTGGVGLSAWTADQPDYVQIGTSTYSANEYPVSVASPKRRTQSIYFASEINHAGTINALALNIAELSGSSRNNWTIRLKHTKLSKYSILYWDSDGWTVVHQSTQSPTTLGWEYYIFDTPFEYDGTSNLMVDISFDNGSSASIPGGAAHVTNKSTRSLVGSFDSNTYGSPTSWSGRYPIGHLSIERWIPNIQLAFGDTLVNVPVTPQQSPNFTNGRWSGYITVEQPASQIYLYADDDFGHVGNSNIFTTY